MILMKSDFLRELFEAFVEKNEDRFLQIANQLIDEEEKKNNTLLAKDLRKIINNSPNLIKKTKTFSKFKHDIPIPRDMTKGFPLIEIKEFYLTFDDIILNQDVSTRLEYLVKEMKSIDLLKSYRLNPKQKYLFCGPPGTGKTMTAKVISSVLNIPLVYVRFDSLISSFLGETATNMRKIFDFIEYGEWVVLFDEFDIVGKKRDDPHEHGEIKRVVNNFMQMLDNYQGSSIIIAATNHQKLLDPAIWRRFDDIIYFDLPDKDRRFKLFEKYLKVMKKDKSVDIIKLSELTDNFSGSDIAQICEDSLRRNVIDSKEELTQQNLIQSIEYQKKRKKIIQNGVNENEV